MKKILGCMLSVLVVGLTVSAHAADEKKAAPAAAAKPAVEAPKVVKVGDVVPEFSLTDPISGKKVSFEKDIKGKTTAIVFMNTGCSACLAELMEMNDLKKEVKDKLQIYAIAVDKRGEAVVKAYAEQYQFDVNYLTDPNFTMPPVYGFSYTPAMILVDKAGKVSHSSGGYMPGADAGKLASAIKKLI